MSGRTHKHLHFFKYSSLETAKRVIESKRFRWSSPEKFNDPFDHQVGFRLDFDQEEFAKSLTTAIERIVFGEKEPTHKPVTPFGAMTLQLRSLRHKMPREEFVRKIHETSIQCAERMHPGVDTLSESIQQQFASDRVFCVSETYDNVVMWSHYAEEHRGAVFKLKCIDEIDNTLLAASPVKYTEDFVPFPSADRYVRHLTEEESFDMGGICWEITKTKHSDWAYEREWRVVLPTLNEPNDNGYSFFAENPRVFEAIYLGCRMAPEDKANLVALIRHHLPTMKVFSATKSQRTFTLDFDEV